jgi:hypothetical protein
MSQWALSRPSGRFSSRRLAVSRSDRSRHRRRELAAHRQSYGRLKNTGIFKGLEFPLVREGDGTELERCTWKARFPTQAAIDQKRQELGDIGLRREMLLQVVPEEGQDVLPEDIH